MSREDLNQKKPAGNERLHLTVYDQAEIESIMDELRWIRETLDEESAAYHMYSLAIVCIDRATKLGQ